MYFKQHFLLALFSTFHKEIKNYFFKNAEYYTFSTNKAVHFISLFPPSLQPTSSRSWSTSAPTTTRPTPSKTPSWTGASPSATPWTPSTARDRSRISRRIRVQGIADRSEDSCPPKLKQKGMLKDMHRMWELLLLVLQGFWSREIRCFKRIFKRYYIFLLEFLFEGANLPFGIIGGNVTKSLEEETIRRKSKHTT